MEAQVKIARALRAEAKRLADEQLKARGTVRGKNLHGKPCRLPGPYEATPENEARAEKILNLRKRAGNFEGPIR